MVSYAALSARWTSAGSGWYRSLHRPRWQPPDLVFGVIWPLNFGALAIVGLVVALEYPLRDGLRWLGLLAASVALALGWAHAFYLRHALGRAAVLLGGATVLTWALVLLTHIVPALGWLGAGAVCRLAHRRDEPRGGLLAPAGAAHRGRRVRFSPAGASTHGCAAEVGVRSQRRDHIPPERTLMMNLRRLGVSAAVLGLAAATIAPAASASTPSPLGNRSLAAVLTSDGNQFDSNWYDYDIVTEAVIAVIAAKPGSAVNVLKDGNVPLTAFIPNDRAFQVLVRDLTGSWPRSEQATFQTVASLGIDTVEAVLLYHVVLGDPITKNAAVKANGVELTTAAGGTFKVRVYNRYVPIIELRDQDPNDVNPFLNPRALDINKGNKQVAHGIVFVLRPVDL